MNYQLLQGDNRAVLRTLPDQSVHCIVTSPPYYGLRDYGEAGQIGLEATPEQYVAELVNVFRECWRVLRDDGVLFLNLGDSYSGSGTIGRNDAGRNFTGGGGNKLGSGNPGRQGIMKVADGLKPKDLIGIPWLVAFALRADGWYLRSDIIWHKPNPMPESVTDRPTKAHEYIFLLTKSQRYYYDADAVREPMSEATKQRDKYGFNGAFKGQFRGTPGEKRYQNGRPLDEPSFYNEGGRNRRSVWTVATAPYSGAHFATFPPALIEPCILAGTSEYGCCNQCGAPWERVVERTDQPDISAKGSYFDKGKTGINGCGRVQHGERYIKQVTGWQATCACNADVIPCTVCDPFNGSGTTVAVAVAHGRTGIGIDLSADYIELAHERIREAINESGRAYIAPMCKVADFVDLPLFGG